eukprot:3527678-Prymnesium_polylepis.1
MALTRAKPSESTAGALPRLDSARQSQAGQGGKLVPSEGAPSGASSELCGKLLKSRGATAAQPYRLVAFE